jgi:hypothetical protein
VGRLAGVLGVTNQISLAAEPIPSDVADRINRAFQRNAIIDGSLIEVSNLGHIIYLDGTTTTWSAMSEALDTAWAAPGVTRSSTAWSWPPSRRSRSHPENSQPGPHDRPTGSGLTEPGVTSYGTSQPTVAAQSSSTQRSE